MIKIGITGSLSSGKSTAVKFLKKSKYPAFSADQIVRQLYQNKIFLKKIRLVFKIKKKSDVKKQIKAKIIEDKNNLKKLEILTHTFVRKKMFNFMKKHKRDKISIYEIPLLVESKLIKKFNIVIFIGAPKNTRLKRYLKLGGSKSFFKVLDGRQLSQKNKMRLCDHIIVNNKSLFVLKKNIRNIIELYE